MKKCSIDGCTRPHRARGWCTAHYQRWIKYGDPTTTVLFKGDHLQRFWTNVEKTASCWVWTGDRNYKGYGMGYLPSAFGNQTVGAHRISYVLVVGPIPDGMHLDHLCRVRHCVNPDHLEPVTREENLRRGDPSPSDVNRLKTECKNGHPFDLANTYRRAKGGRGCRTCRLDYMRSWHAAARLKGVS